MARTQSAVPTVLVSVISELEALTGDLLLLDGSEPFRASYRRDVYVTSYPSKLDELARHLAAYPVPGDDELVFTAPAGGPISRTVFRNRIWVPTVRRAGIDPLPTFHDLRHTGVALAIKAGAHPRTIQAWVGHSSITTRMDVYGHLYDEAHEELAAGLDTLRASALAERQSVAEIVALGN